MPRTPRPARSVPTLVVSESVRQTDFGDTESQRVLRAAAGAVAREIGRRAAREYFDELIRTREGI